jgi:hypothetical protein
VGTISETSLLEWYFGLIGRGIGARVVPTMFLTAHLTRCHTLEEMIDQQECRTLEKIAYQSPTMKPSEKNIPAKCEYMLVEREYKLYIHSDR